MAEVTLKDTEELLELITTERPLPCVCFEGPAGIGKSSLAKQFFQKRGYPFVFVNTAAVLTEPGDILGLPDKSKGKTVYLPPFWAIEVNKFAKENPDKIVGLIFDDFSRVPAQILQSMMSIFLDRLVGATPLEPNILVLLTGNPSKKKEYATRALDKAQQERIQVLNLRFDLECFLGYAARNNFNPEFLAFCSAYPENFQDDSEKGAPMSPRMAEAASRALNAIRKAGYPLDSRIAKTRLDAIVGESIRETFIVCLQHQQDILQPDAVLDGKIDEAAFLEMMKRPDLMYLTYTRLASAVIQKEGAGKIKEPHIRNLRKFIMRVERDEMNFLFLNIIPQKVSKSILDGDTFTVMRARLWGN